RRGACELKVHSLRRFPMAARLPTFADLLAARRRLGALACRTPLIEHPALNARVGGRVLLKAENLQRVGAFKFRGAYNKVAQVDRKAFPGGVVACSSGNHAEGVAAAATLMGLRSAIVMPADAPRLKIDRTRAFGAEVVAYDRVSEDRDAIARELCRSRSAAYVHPFDDIDVIAGQGTAGLEMMEQAEVIGAVPDIVLVGASGGGLISGIFIAVKEESAGGAPLLPACRCCSRRSSWSPAPSFPICRSGSTGQGWARARSPSSRRRRCSCGSPSRP